MSFRVRAARMDDVPRIAPWTSDTFEWGDYVATSLPDWIADPDLYVMVCELNNGVPVAVLPRPRCSQKTKGGSMLPEFTPTHRRLGLGNAMNQAGVAWTVERGARVVRLAVETDNESATRQVANLGYRETCRWVYGSHDVVTTDRITDEERLRPSHSSDVDGAWMFWSNSELALAAHDLVPQGWRWRRMRVEDLKAAVAAKTLFQSPAGWVIAEHRGDALFSNLMATVPADAPRVLRALIDHAVGRRLWFVEIKLPSTPWTIEVMTRSGFEAKEVVVFSKPVGIS